MSVTILSLETVNFGNNYACQMPSDIKTQIIVPSEVYGGDGLYQSEPYAKKSLFGIGSRAPSSSTGIGEYYFDNTNHKLYEYNGTGWVEKSPRSFTFTVNKLIFKDKTNGKLYGIFGCSSGYVMVQIYNTANIYVYKNSVSSENIVYSSLNYDVSSGSAIKWLNPIPTDSTDTSNYNQVATYIIEVKYYAVIESGLTYQVSPRPDANSETANYTVYGYYKYLTNDLAVTVTTTFAGTHVVAGVTPVKTVIDVTSTHSPMMRLSSDYDNNLSNYGFKIYVTKDTGDYWTGTVGVDYGIKNGYFTSVSQKYYFRHAEFTFIPVYAGLCGVVVKCYTYNNNTGGSYPQFYGTPFNVWNKPNPTLTLVSSTGANDLLGQATDGVNGLAPFSTVWRDDTPSQSYCLPVTSIIFDFGTNSDDSVVTTTTKGTTQNYVFKEYRKYAPTLTYICANGEQYIGKGLFEPSITQRIVGVPMIKHSVNTTWHAASGAYENTGVRPDVVVCGACPAGNPLPYIEWVLESTTSGTHQGEYGVSKDGEFAEFALSYNLNYALYCDVYEDETKETRIGARVTFLLTVPANNTKYLLPAVNDSALSSYLTTQDDFTVWILDDNNLRITLLRPARMQYSESWSDRDYVEFDVPSEYPYLSYLLPNKRIIVGYLGIAREMIVNEYNENNYQVTIVAQDAASVAMSSRVAIVSTHSTTGNGYDYQISPAETMLQYFPISNIIETGRTNNELVVLAKNQERGGKCVYSARYENILDIIREVCSDSGLGFSSALYSETVSGGAATLVCGMWIRAGSDLTAGEGRIVFEEKRFKTARVGNYRQFSESNVAVTAGKGEGNTRQYKQYTSYNENAVYEVLEYIQGTGTQYLNTGIPYTENSVITVDFKINNFVSEVNIAGICATEYFGGPNSRVAFFTNQNSNYFCTIFNTSLMGDFVQCDFNRHVAQIDYANDKTVLDGTDYAYTRSKLTPPNTPMYVFGYNPAEWSSVKLSAMNLYAYSQTDNGVTVINLKPARRLSDGVLGAYDTVSGTFFTNIGTGVFIAGEPTGEYIGYPEGMARAEIFVDAGDSADSDEQERMGMLELAGAKQNSITVYPNLKNVSCIFGSHYNVGDKVCVITRSGLSLQKVINSAKYSKDSTGVNLTLECGDDLKGYRFMIRQNKLQNAYSRK